MTLFGALTNHSLSRTPSLFAHHFSHISCSCNLFAAACPPSNTVWHQSLVFQRLIHEMPRGLPVCRNVGRPQAKPASHLQHSQSCLRVGIHVNHLCSSIYNDKNWFPSLLPTRVAFNGNFCEKKKSLIKKLRNFCHWLLKVGRVACLLIVSTLIHTKNNMGVFTYEKEAFLWLISKLTKSWACLEKLSCRISLIPTGFHPATMPLFHYWR